MNFTRNYQKILMFLVVIIFISTTRVAQCAAKSYFVSPTGSNAFAGNSDSTPFRSISRASSKAQPGDTIFIMSGTYDESIAPTKSGIAGKPITYVSYQSKKVVINSQNSNGQAILNNLSYIVIDGISFQNAKTSWITMSGSNHVRITNCNFTTAFGKSGIDITGGASYALIDHSTMTATCKGGTAGANPPGGVGGPADLISIAGNANHILIEKNIASYAGHYAVNLRGGSQNVIQNNYIRNLWHGGIGLYFSSGTQLDDNVVQDNTIVDGAIEHENNLCNSTGQSYSNWKREQFTGLEVSATNSIIRRNVFINNGSAIHMSTFGGDNQNNHIYNNSFSQNFESVHMWGDVNPLAHTSVLSNNVFKNNIMYQDQNYSVFALSDGSLGENLLVKNNIFSQQIYYRSKTGSVFTIQSAYSTEWQNNISEDPLFVNVAGKDLRLTESSPMIGAGGFLTIAMGKGGISTKLHVEDTRYFTDGFGIISGDKIQMKGSTQTAQIVAIDRNKHILILSTSVTFTNGDPVSLSHAGSAPDMGALEH